jgi:hypothetical protein
LNSLVPNLRDYFLSAAAANLAGLDRIQGRGAVLVDRLSAWRAPGFGDALLCCSGLGLIGSGRLGREMRRPPPPSDPTRGGSCFGRGSDGTLSSEEFRGGFHSERARANERAGYVGFNGPKGGAGFPPDKQAQPTLS